MECKVAAIELGRVHQPLVIHVPYLYEMLVASNFSQRHTLIIRATHQITLMYAPDGGMDVDPDNWSRISFDSGIRSRGHILKHLSDGRSVFHRFWVKSILASSQLRRSNLHDSHVFEERFFEQTNSASNKDEMISILERISSQLCLTREGLYQRKSLSGANNAPGIQSKSNSSHLLVRRMINGRISGVTVTEQFNDRFGVEITDEMISADSNAQEAPCIVDYARDRRFTLQQAELIFELTPVAQYCRHRIAQMRNLSQCKPINQQEDKELAVLAFRNMLAQQNIAVQNGIAFH